jgi:hypothetical protein
MCGSASGQRADGCSSSSPARFTVPMRRRVKQSLRAGRGLPGTCFFSPFAVRGCAPEAACPFYRFFPLSRLECSKKKEREVGTACKRNITGLCDVIAVITVIQPSFRLHLPGSRRPRGPIVPHSLYSSRENLFRQPN